VISFSLRSRRQHKAWGVSPRNDAITNHPARGAGGRPPASNDESMMKFESRSNDSAVAHYVGSRILSMTCSWG
jgi:hypothetical protein